MRKPVSRLNVVPDFQGHPAKPVYMTPPAFHFRTAPSFWRSLVFPAALAGALVVGAAAVFLAMLNF